MVTITAKQANELTNSVLQELKKDRQELIEVFDLIKQRAWEGKFWVRTNKRLSENNVKSLRSLGFVVLELSNDRNNSRNVIQCNHISWYDEKEKIV